MSQKIKSSIYFAVLLIACAMYSLSENTDDNKKDYTNTGNETIQEGTVSYNDNYLKLN